MPSSPADTSQVQQHLYSNRTELHQGGHRDSLSREAIPLATGNITTGNIHWYGTGRYGTRQDGTGKGHVIYPLNHPTEQDLIPRFDGWCITYNAPLLCTLGWGSRPLHIVLREGRFMIASISPWRLVSVPISQVANKEVAGHGKNVPIASTKLNAGSQCSWSSSRFLFLYVCETIHRWILLLFIWIYVFL